MTYNEGTILLKNCPQCGSGDVGWDNISVRPYCKECHHWGKFNRGSARDAIESWNNESKPVEKKEDTRLLYEIKILSAGIESLIDVYVSRLEEEGSPYLLGKLTTYEIIQARLKEILLDTK